MRNHRLLVAAIAVVTICLGAFSFSADAKKKAGEEVVNYEITGNGTGSQSTYLVDVAITGKNKDVTDKELVKAAVHGVLFRGFNNPKAHNTQKPLAGSAANEAQHADFYKEFFGDSGTAANYGSIVRGTRQIMKSGKEYKVSATVQVQKEQLLKYLTEMGMVRSLNSAF